MSLSPLKHKEVQLVDDLRSLQVSSAKQKIAATATSSKSPSASYSSAKEHITQAKKAIRSVLEQHEEYIHLTAVDQEPACDLWSEVGKFVLDLIKLNKPTRPNARTKALVFRVAAIKQYLRKLKKNSAKPPQALRVLRQLMEAAEGLNSLEAELEKRNAQELAAEMGLRYLDLRLSRPTIAVLDREIKKQELLRLNSNMEEEKDSDSNTDSLGETSTTCCPSSSSAAVDYHFREKDLDSDSDSDSDSLDETSKTPYCSPASLDINIILSVHMFMDDSLFGTKVEAVPVQGKV
ncbi:hypothetical protein B0T17DRAFT_652025 [Bombardia bombarda]|uniref:Uncharacterized protein n=1 Tax=Bombardia bombarda TaxID=252184 RepID=A0AA40CHJ3_9PEZI|nr:hypothetical protein B0T17DRAFT_652025 [Bombardia bombarda]